MDDEDIEITKNNEIKKEENESNSNLLEELNQNSPIVVCTEHTGKIHQISSGSSINYEEAPPGLSNNRINQSNENINAFGWGRIELATDFNPSQDHQRITNWWNDQLTQSNHSFSGWINNSNSTEQEPSLPSLPISNNVVPPEELIHSPFADILDESDEFSIKSFLSSHENPYSNIFSYQQRSTSFPTLPASSLRTSTPSQMDFTSFSSSNPSSNPWISDSQSHNLTKSANYLNPPLSLSQSQSQAQPQSQGQSQSVFASQSANIWSNQGTSSVFTPKQYQPFQSHSHTKPQINTTPSNPPPQPYNPIRLQPDFDNNISFHDSGSLLNNIWSNHSIPSSSSSFSHSLHKSTPNPAPYRPNYNSDQFSNHFPNQHAVPSGKNDSFNHSNHPSSSSFHLSREWTTTSTPYRPYDVSLNKNMQNSNHYPSGSHLNHSQSSSHLPSQSLPFSSAMANQTAHYHSNQSQSQSNSSSHQYPLHTLHNDSQFNPHPSYLNKNQDSLHPDSKQGLSYHPLGGDHSSFLSSSLHSSFPSSDPSFSQNFPQQHPMYSHMHSQQHGSSSSAYPSSAPPHATAPAPSPAPAHSKYSLPPTSFPSFIFFLVN